MISLASRILPCPRLIKDQMSRSRGYVFTLNNYNEQEVERLGAVECKYLVYGEEVGESGTPHLQGFVYFDTLKSFKQVKALLGSRFYVDKQRGSLSQAIDYCKKDAKFKEFGVAPIGAVGKKCTQAERAERNKRLRDTPLNELVDSGEISIKEVRALKNARLDLAQEAVQYEHDDVRGEWYWGDPGTGKSRKARSENPGAYLKMQNKWWDGYQGEEVVILDDYDTDTLGHHLKIWADRYACTGEVKGGIVNLVHKKFIVTSNYPPEHFWPQDEQLVKAVRRRFKVIHFNKTG